MGDEFMMLAFGVVGLIFYGIYRFVRYMEKLQIQRYKRLNREIEAKLDEEEREARGEDVPDEE